MSSAISSKTVLLLGGSGQIGREAARALLAEGRRLVCALRPGAAWSPPAGVEILEVAATRPHAFREALERALSGGPTVDAVVSCLASRTGAPEDAWAVDHTAQLAALKAAEAAGVPLFVALSAICVQKPRLAFQHAKLAFEKALIASPIAHSIVRPTAYFSSLSGQVARVKAGKPYLLFGDGGLTATKAIGPADVGRYLAGCLTDPTRRGVRPIGGPGPAVTPREQGERLFELLGRRPRFTQIPLAAMDAVIAGLAAAGRVSRRARNGAEFARIARYYASESMLLWDAAAEAYDADATPSFGRESLFDHYQKLVAGAVETDLGAHAVF
ncbi:MAG: NAD(P)H-binding protein [Pseudomonadota bacterium]